MFKKFAKKFSDWKGKEKKFEDLSGSWYENASAVYVSQRELEKELFDPIERNQNKTDESTEHTI